MSAAPQTPPPALLPPLAELLGERPFAWHAGRAVPAAEFLAHAARLAERVPRRRYAINLCEDRYDFLVGFALAQSRGQTTLLPSSRAPAVIAEVLSAYGDCAIVTDGDVDFAAVAAAPDAGFDAAAGAPALDEDRVSGDAIAAIGFTSGSTGTPKAHAKRWDSFATSTALNAAALRGALAARGLDGRMPWIVATVPPQHMYGMEMSVLLPLFAGMGVHAARPLFPADVAAALADVPVPRILVSTPVHLRALVDSGLTFPDVAAVVCATAPLDAALAAAVEARLATDVVEMFGSTETCVLATRRTARESAWSPYASIRFAPAPDGTRVEAPWIDPPVMLQDVIELLPDGRFTLAGRNVDMVEIAGKRASLADITRRLLAVPGVRDAVVFQPEANGAAVRRVAALVVAPELGVGDIIESLRASVDPAFLPRPLVRVDSLPRNELGKLPRERLLAALVGTATP